MNKITLGVLIFLSFCIYSCVAGKKKKKINNPEIGFREIYRVNKIDSIKNVYLIYAQKDTSLYKIVSLKDSIPCIAIQVGGKYPFVLHSRVPKSFNGADVSPGTVPHISGVMFYGVWIELESSSNNDVFTAYNLRGLCMQ